MRQHHDNRHVITLFLLALGFLIVSSQTQTVEAATGLMSWDFAGNVGDETTVTADHTATNVSSTAPSGVVSRGGGIAAANNAGRFNANSWTQPTLADAMTNNDYFEWTIAPDSGFHLEITSIIFNFERSATGPTEWALRSSQDGFATDLWAGTGLTSGTIQTANLIGFTNLTSSVTFRLYGYGNTNASGSAGFEGAGDDLILNVSVSALLVKLRIITKFS